MKMINEVKTPCLVVDNDGTIILVRKIINEDSFAGTIIRCGDGVTLAVLGDYANNWDSKTFRKMPKRTMDALSNILYS